MEYYLIIARSVTYAQRIERVLSRAGIRSLVFRAPLELTGGAGCSYAVRVAPEAMPAVGTLLRSEMLDNVRVLKTDGPRILEVGL